VGTAITVGNRWAIGDFDTDRLIDTADEIGGIPCVALDHVIAYKRLAGRAKDLNHLDIIECHRAGGADSVLGSCIGEVEHAASEGM
jgi:hypothetical protein